MRFRLFAALAFTTLAGCELLPTNPFDLETPCEFQARATIDLTIQAVTSPEQLSGGSVAGPCEIFESDHSGFVVVLSPEAVCDDNAGEVQLTTTENGKVRFDNVPAGTYTLSFSRAGYDVPRDQLVVVNVGKALMDATVFCALNGNPPPTPTVQALPPLVDGDNIAPGESQPAAVVLVDPSPSLAYSVVEIPDDGPPSAARTIDASAPSPLVLEPANDAEARRRTWRVVVAAEDALGNVSELVLVVVKDELAPPQVAGVFASALTDRVFLTWDEPPVTPGDDGAVSYLVSYGVVARPASSDPECPEAGRPFDEVIDGASFALEGTSPLPVAATSLTLSGVLPGTDVFLYVAGVDAAGNAGCFSTVVLARPDDVTFELSAFAALPGVEGTRTFAQNDDVTALARGSGGLTIIDRAGVAHDVAGIADDVVADGGRFIAVGAAGALVVDVDDSGAPVGAGTTTSLEPLFAVERRFGRVLLGTAGGVRTADPDDIAGASAVDDVGHAGESVVRIENAGGDRIVLVRGGSPPRVQLVNAALDVQAEVALPAAPRDILVHDARVIVTMATGVLSLDAANLAGGSDATPLPGSAQPGALLPFDDVVLVVASDELGVDADAILALSISGSGSDVDIDIVGKASLAADESALSLLPQSAGFCALADTAADTVRRCFGAVSLPIADREVRMQSPARIVRMDGATAYLIDDDLVSVHDLGGGLLGSASTGGDRLTGAAALPGIGLFAVDETARAFVISPTGALREIAGAAAALRAGAPALSGDVSAFAAAHGDDVLVSLTDAAAGAGTAPAALVRLRIDEAATGAVTAALVDALPLPDIDSFSNLVVHRNRAYLPTQPFGLLVVNLAAATPALVVAESVVPEADLQSSAFDAAFVSVDGVEHVLVPARRGGVERVFVIDDPAPIAVNAGGLPLTSSASRLGDLVVFGAGPFGAFVVAVVDDGAELRLGPVLRVPTLADLREPVVTARGFAAAIGEEARWIRLR